MEFLRFITGSSIIIAAVAWLVKSIITHFLSKNIDSYKLELKHNNDIALEDTRYNLNLTMKEHEAKMSSLYTKRADVVTELYVLLVKFINNAESFASPFEILGEPDKDKKLTSLSNSNNEFLEFYRSHKIYFSKGICEKIDALWKKAFKANKQYAFWRGCAKDCNENQKEHTEAWINAGKAMKDEIPSLLVLVEDEFRSVLGVPNQ